MIIARTECRIISWHFEPLKTPQPQSGEIPTYQHYEPHVSSPSRAIFDLQIPFAVSDDQAQLSGEILIRFYLDNLPNNDKKSIECAIKENKVRIEAISSALLNECIENFTSKTFAQYIDGYLTLRDFINTN